MSYRQHSNPDNFKIMLAYIPFVNVYLFFTEDNIKSKELFIHIRYSLMIFWIFILASSIFSIFLPFFQPILILAYVWIIWYIIYKINIWAKIDFKILDDLEKNIKSKLK